MTTKITKKKARNARARAHTRLIAEKLNSLLQAVKTFDYETLRAIDDDLAQLTESNCWWLEYELRDPMRKIVGMAILTGVEDKRRASEFFNSQFRP